MFLNGIKDGMVLAVFVNVSQRFIATVITLKFEFDLQVITVNINISEGMQGIHLTTIL